MQCELVTDKPAEIQKHYRLKPLQEFLWHPPWTRRLQQPKSPRKKLSRRKIAEQPQLHGGRPWLGLSSRRACFWRRFQWLARRALRLIVPSKENVLPRWQLSRASARRS